MAINRLVKLPKEINVILLLLLVSFLVSLALLFGQLDPDYYSYLFIGQAVKGGLDMFSDIATNKGITNHLFFTLTSDFLSNNFRLKAIFLSSIVDTATAYLTIKVIQTWIDKKFSITLKNVSFLVLYFVFLKSFLIGPYLGGFLSESITFPLILASLYFFKKDSKFLSALFFVMGVMGRLTLVFWGFMFVLEYVVLNRKIKKLTLFILYGLISFSLIVYLSKFFGSLTSFYDNFVIYNLNYSKAINQNRFMHLFSSLSSLPNILYTLILSVSYTLYYLIFKQKSAEHKLTILFFLVASSLSTFVGGYFFYHHFYQFSLVIFIFFVYFMQSLNKIVRAIIFTLSTIILFFHFSYYLFLSKPTTNFDSKVDKVIETAPQQYLHIISYHPDFYLSSGKISPDRYYIPFFLSDAYNSRANFYKKHHSNLSKEKLKNTVFVSIIKNETDYKITNEYLNNFQDTFELEQIDEIDDYKTPYQAFFYVSKAN